MKKFVQFRFLALIIAMLFTGAAYAQEDNKVIFYVYDAGRVVDTVSNVSPEKVIVDAIKDALGYEVKMFRTIGLENATPEQLDSLNAADLVIIGRAIGSWNWTVAGRNVWDSVITTPVLSINPFSIRTNQLAWFFGSEVYGGVEGEDVFATVEFPEDPIFEGVDLDENNRFALWNGGFSAIKLDTTFLGNGKLMITNLVPDMNELQVFFARFEANTPFYESGASPVGPRSYMGMGIDGDNNYRYWKYSDAGKAIFLAEVERLATLGDDDTNVGAIEAINANVYPNPATNSLSVRMNNLKKAQIMDLTGKLIYSVDGNGHEVNFDISNLNAGIYLIRAFDNNNNTVVRKVVKN